MLDYSIEMNKHASKENGAEGDSSQFKIATAMAREEPHEEEQSVRGLEKKKKVEKERGSLGCTGPFWQMASPVAQRRKEGI